ncbi:hypothetical protein [Mycoplasma phocimorsus]|uniref:hypothetical protein n=1 Tax=Mycoplasma phocimorsus TaxID=3045839 RepID=UPI0024BFA97E|nr:hypothetical protein [Mycoplasma phocimorsus]MDJ1647387.1 hypothetical protein [Mycoplasma phocimorsus]
MYRIKESWTLKSYTTVFKGAFSKNLEEHEYPLQMMIEDLADKAYELKTYSVKYNVIDKSIEVMVSVVPAGKGNDAVEINAEEIGSIVYNAISTLKRKYSTTSVEVELDNE